MQDAQNIQIVKDAYAAFGRGDIQALLGMLDENVIWKPVTGATRVPTAGTRRGRASVGEFFRVLSESIAFSQFEPREFVAQNGKVVVLGFYRGTSIKHGSSFQSEWVMIFTLSNGRVVEFQEFADSAGLDAAFPAAVATA